MIKPNSLRKAIVRVAPGLEKEPDRLMIWIERGSVSSRMTSDFSFAWEYRLTILIEGLTEAPSIIAIAITNWLRVNQPERLVSPNKAFDFDTDIINNAAIDLKIEIDLTEQVQVVRRPDGGFDMLHLPEPDPLFDDDLPAGGGDIASEFIEAWLLSEGVTGAEKLIPDEPPLGADVQSPGAVP